jgi:hypothetical protein
MTNFQTKYPAFYALLALMAGVGTGLVAQGETLVQKLEGEAAQLPNLLAFLPQVGSIGPELTALKSSPADIVTAGEVLVTDFAFSSDKAKAIIQASFPLAESLAGLYPQVVTLVAALKA